MSLNFGMCVCYIIPYLTQHTNIFLITCQWHIPHFYISHHISPLLFRYETENKATLLYDPQFLCNFPNPVNTQKWKILQPNAQSFYGCEVKIGQILASFYSSLYNTAFLGNLIFNQPLVRNGPTFNGTHFTTMFTITCNFILPRARRIQSTNPHVISLRYIQVTAFRLCLHLSSNFFLVLQKNLNITYLFPMSANSHPSNLFHLFITLIVFSKQFKSWTSSRDSLPLWSDFSSHHPVLRDTKLRIRKKTGKL
jgi:hypothetical protein